MQGVSAQVLQWGTRRSTAPVLASLASPAVRSRIRATRLPSESHRTGIWVGQATIVSRTGSSQLRGASSGAAASSRAGGEGGGEGGSGDGGGNDGSKNGGKKL